MAGVRDVTISWRPHHDVHPELPPEQDFLAFDDAREKSIGQVYLMEHSGQSGRWRWSMYAQSTTGRVPFETYGYEDSRGEAGRRVLYSDPAVFADHPWRRCGGCFCSGSGLWPFLAPHPLVARGGASPQLVEASPGQPECEGCASHISETLRRLKFDELSSGVPVRSRESLVRLTGPQARLKFYENVGCFIVRHKA